MYFHLSNISPFSTSQKTEQHTKPHNNQKPRTEPPKIYHCIPTRFDEIIRVSASATDPIWQRREDVGCDDQEGEVLFKEGAGEDYEKEADC